MPDGRKTFSTHTCDLDIDDLPAAAKKGHILPGLASHALISVGVLCDHGCTVTFEKDKCCIFFKGREILRGPRNPKSRLWEIPLSKNGTTVQLQPSNQHAANAMHHTSNKVDLMKFLHQSCFSPVPSTWIRAVDNNQFTTWPGLSAKNIRKYLPPSPASLKGHMDRTRKNARSTKIAPTFEPRLEEQQNIDDLFPKQETRSHGIFVEVITADATTGKVYTDLTGRFPVMSLRGMQYIFVLYDYDSNAILVEPMKSRSDADMEKAYNKLYDYLTDRGLKPKFNVMDNEASTAIKKLLTQRDTKFQLVEPHNHRVNAAERAIRTFKNHFIAGLCTVDKDFPLQLWDRLLPQTMLTLNLLRTSRINPRLSAEAQLNGNFDFNKTPLAPPGTRALVFEDPTNRGTFAPHAIDAWYLSHAKDNYRCHKFFIPSTNGERIAQTAEFFPQHCNMPGLSSSERATIAATDLTDALLHPAPKSPFSKLSNTHYSALKKLAAIFKRATKSDEDSAPPPRVGAAETSTNPTLPRVVQSTPRVATHRYPTRQRTELSDLPTPPPAPTIPLVPLVSQDTVYSASHVLPSARQPVMLNPSELMQAFDITKVPWHYAGNVVDPVTGESQNYQQLIKNPKTQERWSLGMCYELGRLSNGFNGRKDGTQTVHFMTHEEIKNIPTDRTVTYARIVVVYRSQKADPYRVRITVGGNLIDYPGEVTTRTADIVTSKIMWNSVLSTKDAKYMCADASNFYLETPMERREYMRIRVELVPTAFMDEYNLHDKVKNGYIYMEIRRGMYGLPQAGILANTLLKERLAPFGYYEAKHTPGLFLHKWRPVQFTLVVDDFGVKYVGREHAQHLIDSLETHYTVAKDWDGSLYCGISLKWDYKQRTCDISMPTYIEKQLHKFRHDRPKRPQHSPFRAQERKYGKDAQKPLEPDTSPPVLDKERKLRIQQIVGALLYYARAVDMTILVALSAIASQQNAPTEQTESAIDQLLDYVASNPVASVRFHASDMILQIHSDASYLTEPKARSRVAGHFFLGKNTKPLQPIFLNGNIHTLCGILKHVVSSASEAELAALFMNAREGKIMRLTLIEMKHPQPATPIHTDNTTADGIVNGTVKRQRSRAMDMRYYWIVDQSDQGYFKVVWAPGLENLGDYPTKHHDAKHHKRVRPFYLHEVNSPRYLPRALPPSVLRGCVDTLSSGYSPRSPLPSISRVRTLVRAQSLALRHQLAPLRRQ
jgi:hypothetical protein